ncbi:MAG: DNA replication/repair protein RecF [Cytophagales bacterium]|nr:DNA replication/repair protein RecF [Bernardetiaceae bacterium]MDW8203877.1 DNA replication/repair protein RecF [Cytophagales bacterium]
MYLKELHLRYFKNYHEATFNFSPGINGIVGKNGAGKTNLLDAIYYLCMTKSAFQNTDQANMHFGQHFFTVEGTIEHEDVPVHLQVSFSRERGKIFKLNKKVYSKLSEHVGRFPCVLVTPYDSDLIREGSEVRRRFFDAMLCQINKTYLEELMRYNRLLQQRNSLLKQVAALKQAMTMLEVYDEQMAYCAHFIAKARTQFVNLFLPMFLNHYRFISQSEELVSLAYQTCIFSASSFVDLMRQHLNKDIALQYTSQGIHRDDFIFEMNGNSVKKFASQGQQKSYTLALRLAQFEVLATQTGKKPILLLDDIFDKLDDVRIKQLMLLMSENRFGQVFVTDARPERTEKLFNSDKIPIQIVQV